MKPFQLSFNQRKNIWKDTLIKSNITTVKPIIILKNQKGIVKKMYNHCGEDLININFGHSSKLRCNLSINSVTIIQSKYSNINLYNSSGVISKKEYNRYKYELVPSCLLNIGLKKKLLVHKQFKISNEPFS